MNSTVLSTTLYYHIATPLCPGPSPSGITQPVTLGPPSPLPGVNTITGLASSLPPPLPAGAGMETHAQCYLGGHVLRARRRPGLLAPLPPPGWPNAKA